MTEPGILYVVATPIGNLQDISPRCAATFGQADFIAAEDTRVTAKLMNHLGLKKPMVSYYQHNMLARGDEVISRILAGESCALCSDAGTPAVSDPGELLVKQAMDAGIRVVPVSGPCAAITALCASGLTTGRFAFEGFLPMAKKSRREHLAQIAKERRTMIFYEAPHKLRGTLADLMDTFGGDRPVTLARELTKLHEEIVRTTLAEANAIYAERTPKGEYVLVVEGQPMREQDEAEGPDPIDLARKLMEEGMSISQASKQAAAQTGRSKSDIYKELLQTKEETL